MIILFCDLPGTSLKVGGSVHLLLKHVEDHVPQVLHFNLLPYISLAIASGITLAILKSRLCVQMEGLSQSSPAALCCT